MMDICKTLENSKKPLLTKLSNLEKKKASFIEKIDEEMRIVTAKLESIDSAMEALQNSYASKISEPTVTDNNDEIDPFNI